MKLNYNRKRVLMPGARGWRKVMTEQNDILADLTWTVEEEEEESKAATRTPLPPVTWRKLRDIR